MNERFREPNYEAFILVLTADGKELLTEYYIEQEVARKPVSLESVNGVIVAELEAFRDKFGLSYVAHLPSNHLDMNWFNAHRVVVVGGGGHGTREWS